MSTLQGWIADLRHAAEAVDDEGEKVVSKGSLNIKNDWRDRWTGYAHLPHLPRHINYDIDRVESGVESSIGPPRGEPGTQGGLAPYIEYGTPTSAPIPGALPAADAEEPRFVLAVEDLGEKLLDER